MNHSPEPLKLAMSQINSSDEETFHHQTKFSIEISGLLNLKLDANILNIIHILKSLTSNLSN